MNIAEYDVVQWASTIDPDHPVHADVLADPDAVKMLLAAVLLENWLLKRAAAAGVLIDPRTMATDDATDMTTNRRMTRLTARGIQLPIVSLGDGLTSVRFP